LLSERIMPARTLVIGLGNPLLGDDGAGWRVIEALQAAQPGWGAAVELDCHPGGGLALMERLVGYDRAIVIDAICQGQAPAGTVACLPLEALPDPSRGHLASAHEASLPVALALGRQLGAPLPREVLVIGIEAQPTFEFSECLSPAVAEAVPIAARAVAHCLREPTP
jgi:hydrogenase maturation protease